MSDPERTGLFQPAVPADEVRARVAGYAALHDSASATERKAQATAAARTYYDLATSFYETGWGQSFHFAPLAPDEALGAAIVRHQHYLALRMGLAAGMRVLDVGCGVGGPMRGIARLTGAEVVGLNVNDYQIARGKLHNAAAGLDAQCSFVAGDFTAMPLEDASFDAAYTIEAACHAADRRDVFREVHRVLRPGAVFAGYEWCLTDRYRAGHPLHVDVRRGIEKGNSLPELVGQEEVLRSLADSGFEVLASEDRAEHALGAGSPWYSPLASLASWRGLMASRLGTLLTGVFVRALELARLSPRGTTEVHEVLRLAQSSLVAGGQLGIFTPMFFFLARKPVAKGAAPARA
ncbi:MAG: methyltransferase domain-containing protein [Polyangiaceae bacterium]|nr:methyltransferase domain-containing protein [Polyangiaceae bacterium]